LLAFWIASAAPLKLLVAIFESFPRLVRLLSGTRYTGFMAGLAVPPLLGLSAIGLDKLLRLPWPNRQKPFRTKPGAGATVPLRLLVAIPLVYALTDAKSFGARWIALQPRSPEVPQVLQALRTPDLQWVQVPLGEHFWVEPALDRSLKLTHEEFRTWHWRDRTLPDPVLRAERAAVRPGMVERSVIDGVTISSAPSGREYAGVSHSDGRRTVCVSNGRGGHLNVICSSPAAGVLTVKENRWSGWRARVDGRKARLLAGQGLAVALPAGRHRVEFRYVPWDVPLGMLLCLAGIVLSVFLWRKDRLDPPTG